MRRHLFGTGGLALWSGRSRSHSSSARHFRSPEAAIAFGAVRLWEGEPGNVKHAIVRITTIQAIDEPRVKELLDKLSAPRARDCRRFHGSARALWAL